MIHPWLISRVITSHRRVKQSPCETELLLKGSKGPPNAAWSLGWGLTTGKSLLLRHRTGFTSRTGVQRLACRRGRACGRKWLIRFRLVPPLNFLCLLRTPGRVSSEGFRARRGSNHLEGLRNGPQENREPLSGSSRVRGVTPYLRWRAARISAQIGWRKVPGFEHTPNLRGQERKTSSEER